MQKKKKDIIIVEKEKGNKMPRQHRIIWCFLIPPHPPHGIAVQISHHIYDWFAADHSVLETEKYNGGET